MPCSFCHYTGVMHVAEDTESSGTWVAFNIVAASRKVIIVVLQEVATLLIRMIIY
jgi:hypothetical protein